MIDVTMTSPNGVTLDTAGKYCPDNVRVTPQLQQKTATPGEAAQEITPDAGNVGLSKVTVAASQDAKSLKALIQRDSAGLTLPADLGHIGQEAFRGYANLTLSQLPDGIRWVEFGGFYGCSKLAITDMPSKLASLSSYSFGNCTSLTQITFHSTPTSLSAEAFSGCTNITSIRVPWSEGAVAGAPWGAVNANITYDYTGEG